MEIDASSFSFRSRPIPVPGDLRIGWRVALLLLMLGHSRSKRASVAKLHVLNNAIRFHRSKEQLDDLISGDGQLMLWPARVEPAFGRAIDFLVGDGLAEWTYASSRSGLQLTKTGIKAWEILKEQGDILSSERDIIAPYAKQLTEGAVSDLFSTQRSRE